MVDEEGKIERVRPALLADAIATSIGAIFGTSTITSYGRQGQRGETFNVHSVRSVYSEVYLPVMLFEYLVGSDEIFKILFVEKSD